MAAAGEITPKTVLSLLSSRVPSAMFQQLSKGGGRSILQTIEGSNAITFSVWGVNPAVSEPPTDTA